MSGQDAVTRPAGLTANAQVRRFLNSFDPLLVCAYFPGAYTLKGDPRASSPTTFLLASNRISNAFFSILSFPSAYNWYRRPDDCLTPFSWTGMYEETSGY